MNGVLYFAKNMKINSIMQRIKQPSSTKTAFNVMMFSKKFYGKMPGSSQGSYGNWEINLTWED
jgi:hypothetical protein